MIIPVILSTQKRPPHWVGPTRYALLLLLRIRQLDYSITVMNGGLMRLLSHPVGLSSHSISNWHTCRLPVPWEDRWAWLRRRRNKAIASGSWRNPNHLAFPSCVLVHCTGTVYRSELINLLLTLIKPTEHLYWAVDSTVTYLLPKTQKEELQLLINNIKHAESRRRRK